MILLLDSLENGDGKGSFSLQLIDFVHDITYASSPFLLSTGEESIEYGGTVNTFARASQYAGRRRAMTGGKKRRWRGKGFPRHRAVNSNGWERP